MSGSGLSPEHVLQSAWRLHQAGNLSEAARLYQEILRVQPKHFGALQLLGFLYFQREEFDLAERVMAKALKIDPKSVDALYNRGCALQALERDKEALACFDKALAIKRDFAPALLNRGNTLFRLGRYSEALKSYDGALKIQPAYAEALLNRANTLLELERPEDALADYDKALALEPNRAAVWSNRGHALNAVGRHADALASCDKAIALDPNNAAVFEFRGEALAGLKRDAEALRDYARALVIEPDSGSVLHRRARLLLDMKRPLEALADFDLLIALDTDDEVALIGRGVALSALVRHEEALTAFDKVLAFDPNSADTHSNRAHSLIALRRNSEALRSAEKAIALNPSHAVAWHNKGSALFGLKRYTDSLRGFDTALRLDPQRADTLANRASPLAKLKRYQDAVDSCERALALDPGNATAMKKLINSRLNMCDWRALPETRAAIPAALAEGRSIVQAFDNVMLSTSEAQSLSVAKLWVAEECPPSSRPLWRGERYRHDRIRVAYLSTDFRDHAVASLIAGVFEHHDKTRFQTIGLSIGPQDNSDIGRRIAAAFETYVDVNDKSDAEAAAIIRAMEADILIDLNGFTGESRTAILAQRPAPLQINYLGYPGTMGASYVDYIIADRIVIPEQAKAHYSEKVVYLPHSYQPNDDKRAIGDRVFTRSECGLPEDGFVFCSFNQAQKITPEIFSIWMRLLSAVDGSVLWLSSTNEFATRNLIREAESRGIAASRLVFAPFLAKAEDHLARLRLADLFLDTLPFNAHTTASDALWAGLPLVTCIGTTFSGRVAASLLHAARLPDLVTNSLVDYETLTLRLAREPPTLAAIKAKVAAHLNSCALFDTTTFTRNFEAALIEVQRRQREGQPPESFAVASV